MKEPTKHTALCCVCEREFPENEGTFSVPAMDEDSGAYFICNGCQQMEEQAEPIAVDLNWDEGQEDYNEDFPQPYDEGDNP